MFRRLYPTFISAIAFLTFSWEAQGKSPQGQSFSEHDIKAVYVYRLASFIRWPEGEKNNLKYCTLGTDATTQSLERLFSQEGIRGELTAINSLADAALHCDLIFITQDAMQPITPLPQYKGLLTISDSPKVLSEGGMIELRTLNYQVKPALHRGNIQNSQLEVSSKLLRIALHATQSHGENGGSNE